MTSGHAPEIAERALVQPQERLELLIPHGFLVAVARVAQRHPKHPRPAPLARRRVQRRRAAEEIHLAFGARARSETRRRPGASARSSARTASPIRSSRRSRTPRPGPARCAAGSDRRRVSRRSRCDTSRRRTAGAASSRGTFWPGLASEPANVLAAFEPSTVADDQADSAGGDAVGAGERFGRICPAHPVVPADRFATDAGLRFDASVAPACSST